MLLVLLLWLGIAILYTCFLSYMVFIPLWGENGYLATVATGIISVVAIALVVLDNSSVL